MPVISSNLNAFEIFRNNLIFLAIHQARASYIKMKFTVKTFIWNLNNSFYSIKTFHAWVFFLLPSSSCFVEEKPLFVYNGSLNSFFAKIMIKNANINTNHLLVNLNKCAWILIYELFWMNEFKLIIRIEGKTFIFLLIKHG